MCWCRLLAVCGVVGLGLWGCATAGPTVVSPPVERALYYYVGAKELDLHTAADPQSSVSATVTLNERVQKTDQSPTGWFLVQAADGRSGWASERYFKLDPVTDFYVAKWGVRLRAAADNKAKAVSKLRLNDSVKLLDPNPRQGWVQVVVERNQSTGWIELRNLSKDRVVVRRRIRRAPATPGAAAEEATKEAAEEAPETPSLLTPAPAEAAPPPAKKKPIPPRRKARPEMFEPF